MGPCDLDELVKQLKLVGHRDLLVGPEHGSDAGVFRVSDDIAIVQSADFFPPMISDAKMFGKVAAANALSDIYAMGARPVTALNLLATPKDTPQEALVAMLDGAQEVVNEAGAVISGGHTIIGSTVMFGLSATGVIHPDKVIRNTGVVPGDVLVLTKPLGSGITVHAFNAGQVGDDSLDHCIDVMARLNKAAGESLIECGATASTDITGFGLLGHALDMLSLNTAGIEIDFSKVPLMPDAERLALAGNYPGGSTRNCEYTDPNVVYEGDCQAARLVLNDAQTSGGLLVSLPSDMAGKYLDAVVKADPGTAAAIIGRVTAGNVGKITVLCH